MSGRRKILVGLAATAALVVIGVSAFLLLQSEQTKSVTLYGDSLSVESGPYLQRSLQAAGKVDFSNRALSGTSPCDWLPLITADLEKQDPDLAIIEVYGNNASACQRLADGTRSNTDSAAYWQRYRRDLTDVVESFRPSTKVILSAAPAARMDRESGRSHKARMLALMKEVAIGHSNVSVADAGAAVERPKGHFVRIMKCKQGSACPDRPAYGEALVRSLDGLHFCPRIVFATLQLLEHCPIVPYGAWLFGSEEAKAVGAELGLDVSPSPVKKQ